MIPALGFLVGNWQRFLIYGLVVVAFLGTFGMWCYMKGRSALHEYKGRLAVEAAKVIVKQGAVSEKILTKYVKVKGETQVKIEFRDREVIRYEQANLDQCPLSTAFVSLHNSAAANTIPETSSVVDGTSSGIKTSEALSTIQTNYSTYHQTANRLRALQEWVREQEKVRTD
jgi:hypothetical protein